MKAVICLLLGLASAEIQREWTTEELKEVNSFTLFEEWKVDYDKIYDSIEEEAEKYLNFLANLKEIGETNSQDLSYRAGLNEYSDMTHEEFFEHFMGPTGSCAAPPNYHKDMPNLMEMEPVSEDYQPMATSVDWTKKGVVNPIKNQGRCGSCWAFATVANIECNYAIKTGQLNSLSEQQEVDCCRGSHGCSGGRTEAAFDYAHSTGGLCLETAYRYTARDGTCKDRTCGTKYDNIAGYTHITSNNEAAMQSAVDKGCLSVYVTANSAWHSYSGGVFSASCGTNYNHCVTIVGYGVEGSRHYWKVRNSWGSSWGEAGYVRIIKNANVNGSRGECCINCDPNIPRF